MVVACQSFLYLSASPACVITNCVTVWANSPIMPALIHKQTNKIPYYCRLFYFLSAFIVGGVSNTKIDILILFRGSWTCSVGALWWLWGPRHSLSLPMARNWRDEGWRAGEMCNTSPHHPTSTRQRNLWQPAPPFPLYPIQNITNRPI